MVPISRAGRTLRPQSPPGGPAPLPGTEGLESSGESACPAASGIHGLGGRRAPPSGPDPVQRRRSLTPPVCPGQRLSRDWAGSESLQPLSPPLPCRRLGLAYVIRPLPRGLIGLFTQGGALAPACPLPTLLHLLALSWQNISLPLPACSRGSSVSSPRGKPSRGPFTWAHSLALGVSAVRLGGALGPILPRADGLGPSFLAASEGPDHSRPVAARPHL